jgi:Domain of unknown function (DUF4157)
MGIHARAERSQSGPTTGAKSPAANPTYGNAPPQAAFQPADRGPNWNFASIPVSAAPISIQPKLQIGAADDPLEREADEVGGRVMRMPDSSAAVSSVVPRVQRQCSCGGSCDKCQSHEEHGRVQLKQAGSGGPGSTAAPPIVHEVLRGGGQPLDGATRAFMEPRFGRDFSGVRVHAGTDADRAAKAVHARAYTVGQHIVFGSGEFAPTLGRGRQLLAHELTHVVQQNGEGKLVQRAETDTKGGCSSLKDTKPDINDLVNHALVEARGGSASPNPLSVIQGLFDRLGANTSPGRSAIEDWASGLGPDKVIQPSQIDTKYAGVSYRLWKQKFFKILNPTMRVNDICIGSDKLGHFIELGFDYFAMTHRAKKVDTEQFGKDDEAGGHGLTTTGVYSNADQEANRVGLKFYEDLLTNPTLNFDISNYITTKWNEEVNPNLYEENDVAPQVWQNILFGVWEGTVTKTGSTKPVSVSVSLGLKNPDTVEGVATFTTDGKKELATLTGTVTRKTAATGAKDPDSLSKAVSGVVIDFEWTVFPPHPTGKGRWESVRETELKGKWGNGSSNENSGVWDLFKKGVSGTGMATATSAAPAPSKDKK